MCTVFAHALVGLTAAATAGPRIFRLSATVPPAAWPSPASTRLLLIAACSAALPDLDTGLRVYGVDPDGMWGHRGMMHSFLFAALVGVLAAWLGFKAVAPLPSLRAWGIAALVACATASHGVLDLFTDGGNGIALFAPFSSERFFAPWNPLPVPMIGVRHLFTAYMGEVLVAEVLWIGVPCSLVLVLVWLLRRTPRSHAACGYVRCKK